MSIREDMLAMMLDGGEGTASTPLCYKAWQINDTDFFVGVGKMIDFPINFWTNQTQFNTDTGKIEVMQSDRINFPALLGKIHGGVADTVICANQNTGNRFIHEINGGIKRTGAELLRFVEMQPYSFKNGNTTRILFDGGSIVYREILEDGSTTYPESLSGNCQIMDISLGNISIPSYITLSRLTEDDVFVLRGLADREITFTPIAVSDSIKSDLFGGIFPEPNEE